MGYRHLVKHCPSCGVTKPVSAFYPSRRRGRDGWCKHCAICRQPEVRRLYGSTAYLVVDHDHDAGRIRALLCHRCNVALGPIEDRKFHRKALEYLERFA